MRAFLITSSIAAALQFAKDHEWSATGKAGDIWDRFGPVQVTMDPADFEGAKRAVVHVGHFDRTREAQALKRHLLNRAEARNFHIIDYQQFDGDRPEPIRICLVCGLDRPCMWPEDLEPNEPGIPCTFDPTIPQLMARLRAEEKQHAECRRSLAVVTEALYALTLKFRDLETRLTACEKGGKGPAQISRYSRRTA